MRSDIETYWAGMAEIARSMPFRQLERAARMILECRRKGGTVFVAGNGGSAATASHFACDLAKGTRTEGEPLFRVVPLTDNVPLMTAWANDAGYERIFAEQLANLARPGDLVVVISASGNSPNILRLLETSRKMGIKSIGLTGQSGGHVRWLADLVVRVPSDSVEMIEDGHSAITHSLCVALRARLQAQAALRAAQREETTA